MKKITKRLGLGLIAIGVVGVGSFVLENPPIQTIGAGSWAPSGVKIAQYQLSGATVKGWTSMPNSSVTATTGFDLTITKKGVTYLAVSTEDNAGNTDIAMQIIIVGDQGTSVSPIKTIEYQLTGASSKNWTLYNAPFEITQEGVTTINVRVEDEAGNKDTITKTVKLDKTAPINSGVKVTLD